MLEGLVEVVKIQSADISNRIENIPTSAKRLRDLMADKVAPMNRDEREIAGYRYVLDTIYESHDDIPVTPNVILQLHRDLYRFSGTALPVVGKIPTTSSLNGLRVASWSPGSGRPPQPLRPERWKGSARSIACGWSRGSTTRCSSPSSLFLTS